jgi:hypothetical protein
MAQDFPQLPTFPTLGSQTDGIEEQLNWLLGSIEEDQTVPARLLTIAIQLQEALVEQRRRRNPS